MLTDTDPSPNPEPLALPLDVDHLDGRALPPHLQPFVPQVRDLMARALRLREVLGHGPEGYHQDPEPDHCEERWLWQRRLRLIAAELARLVAGPAARDVEATQALEGLRASRDPRDRLRYDAVAAFLVRLDDDDRNEYSEPPYGDGLANLSDFQERVTSQVRAEWDAANPEIAAAEAERAARWRAKVEADDAARAAEEARRAAAAPIGEAHTASLQAIIDRHTAEMSAAIGEIGNAVGAVNSLHTVAVAVNGQVLIGAARNS